VAERYCDGRAAEQELAQAATAAAAANEAEQLQSQSPQTGARLEFKQWGALVANADIFPAIRTVAQELADGLQRVTRYEAIPAFQTFSGTIRTHLQLATGLLREVVGNPFRSVSLDSTWRRWNDGCILKLAQTIYDERTFDRLPILADALEEAGGDNAEMLPHCRGAGPHVRGCWVVDLILGKE
jgi:hypothetical protein